MGYQYVVLGAGRQGVALAYDLAKNCEAETVTLCDSNINVVRRAVDRLRTLCAGCECEFMQRECEVSRPREVDEALRGADVVISAVPFRFNASLTEAAIEAGASFCDLGGNTGVVRTQLERHKQAERAGVSVVPDCGLAPGLGNILAAYGIEQLDEPVEAHVRCGGLPEKPIGPLGYKLLFNFQGLINEYSGFGEILRGGERVEVPTLTELEEIEFPAPVGKCEAAVTSGGTSTCPETFLGKVRDYDYKTVRYPGHFPIISAMFELGCFDEFVRLKSGEIIEPKNILRLLMEERLDYPDVRDITVMRVIVSGNHGGKPRALQFDFFDRHDEATGFTAMERTTAFPATLVAYMQARKLIAPGARPLESCVPLKQYMDELEQHDIRVTTSQI
jgi:lysine 6-dehydrogenase